MLTPVAVPRARIGFRALFQISTCMVLAATSPRTPAVSGLELWLSVNF